MEHGYGIINTKTGGVVTVVLSTLIGIVARHVGAPTKTFVTLVVDSTRQTVVARRVFGPVSQLTGVSHAIADISSTLTGGNKVTIRVLSTSSEFSATTVVHVTITVIVDTVTANLGGRRNDSTHTSNVGDLTRTVTGVLTPLVNVVVEFVIRVGTRTISTLHRSMNTNTISVIARVESARVTIIAIRRGTGNDSASGGIARFRAITIVTIIIRKSTTG